jgi:hypothetical protein
LHNFFNAVKHMQKLCANCRPVCNLENFQWCRELCSADFVNSGGGHVPQIPRWGNIDNY